MNNRSITLSCTTAFSHSILNPFISFPGFREFIEQAPQLSFSSKTDCSFVENFCGMKRPRGVAPMDEKAATQMGSFKSLDSRL